MFQHLKNIFVVCAKHKYFRGLDWWGEQNSFRLLPRSLKQSKLMFLTSWEERWTDPLSITTFFTFCYQCFWRSCCFIRGRTPWKAIHTIMLTLGPLLCDEKIKNLCFHGSPKGRCKKKRIYLRLCPKLWVSGSKGGSKVPNFLVKITIQLFLLQTSRNVLKHVIHKWGGHIWPFHDALRPQRL